MVEDDKQSKESDGNKEEQDGKPKEDKLTLQRLKIWNIQTDLKEIRHADPVEHSKQKVVNFIKSNPINNVFIRREKGRLPYSVFKPHANQVSFLKSIFENRPPTAFFPYPSYIS